MDRPSTGGSFIRDPVTGALKRVDETAAPAIADEPAATATDTEAGVPAEAETKRKSR